MVREMCKDSFFQVGRVHTAIQAGSKQGVNIENLEERFCILQPVGCKIQTVLEKRWLAVSKNNYFYVSGNSRHSII